MFSKINQSMQKIFLGRSDSSPIDLHAEHQRFSDQAHFQSHEATDHFLQTICAADDPEIIRCLATEACCVLTPLGLKELYDRIERVGLRVPVDVFRRVAPLRGLLNRRDIKLPDFANISLSTHARLYRVKEHREPKGLLIVFNAVGALGSNYCRMLTEIPAGLDALFLRRHKDYDYRFGVPGLGNGFLDTCQQLESIVSSGHYQGVGCLGSSLGGLWALRAAMIMRANIGVSLAGRFSRRVRAISPYDQDLEDDPLLHYQQNQSTRLYCFYGEYAQKDVEDAERFRAMVPSVSMIPLKGHSEHHVMPYLKAKRQSNQFYSALHKCVLDKNVELW